MVTQLFSMFFCFLFSKKMEKAGAFRGAFTEHLRWPTGPGGGPGDIGFQYF